jgi:hypothetical protein
MIGLNRKQGLVSIRFDFFAYGPADAVGGLRADAFYGLQLIEKSAAG